MAEEASESPVPSVSNAEWEIMKVLWEHGPMAAREVYAELPAGHGWATKTVKTLLSRLVAKGAVTYEQIGNSYLYRAACTRDEVTMHEVRSFVERVLGGSLRPVIAHFLEEREITEEDFDDLRRLLEGKPKKRGRKGQ